jgi:hypothetical protein
LTLSSADNNLKTSIDMSFNGSEGGLISLQDGAAMTARFRTNFPTQIKARFFGKAVLDQLLNQPGAQGIRMYFAQNANNEMELVICAADENENDMLGMIADMALSCPIRCSSPNSLNK